MQSYSEWILCPSKSFPGKFYYFNVRNGRATWGRGDSEITAGRPPETPKKTESHNHLERNSPPPPDLLQHDFFVNSLRQTPETSHEVTPFSSLRQTPETRNGVTSFSSLRETPKTRHEVTPFSSIRQTPETSHEVIPFNSIRQTTETRHQVTPFSSIQQTPDTRHQVTPFNTIHHPTMDHIRQNFSSFSSMRHPAPVFGQKTFPQGLPKHKDSNVTTPIQIQVHIPLQNQTSTTFGAKFPAFRDHPNISNADESQVSQSMEGFKYKVTQGLNDTECKEILVDASNIPMHQRFVNFEAPGISFSTVNKDNIKRLHQKFQSSTPIKKSKALENPRLANKPRSFESKSSLNFADFKTNTPEFKPKTGNSVMKEPVLNFGLFSNTINRISSNKQDLNVGLPTKIQEEKNINFDVGPPVTNTVPAFNGGLTKSREPLLSNGLPSKSMVTSLNFKPPQKTKEPYVNFGSSKITEALYNLEQPLKTKEPILYFEPPAKTKQPVLNAGTHSKTKETVNFNPPLKYADLNLGSETKEPSNQFEPSLKTKESILNILPLQTNEPVFNGQALKAKDPVLNGLLLNTTEKEINKEPKSVLKGCVKSLKSCIKGDKGDNAVAKSFDDDLRAILISKRKSQDFSKAEGSKPKMSKQETPVKKKVSFNLDHESISMVSSLEDDEDMKCAFIELYRPTLCHLKALGPASSQDTWSILADAEVLTKEIDFIDAFVQIDPTCKLLIPPVVHSCLLALARGRDRPLATAARNVLRRTTSSHVVVQPCNDQDNPTCTSDDLLRCCVENMDQNKHLVLISDDLELLTSAKCYPIPCYSMNSIKNGLPATKPLQYKKDVTITIRNDTRTIKNDSAVKKPTHDVELNEKEKAVIRNLQMSKYPIGQNAKLKEKNQNEHKENPNGKFQNGQTGTGSNEENTIKDFYHHEYMRLANAIDMCRTDTENITTSVNASGISNEYHDISNLSTIQNESMDIEKSIKSMDIDKSVELISKENSNKVKTAETRWRFESEMSNTNIEDEFQKCNIKDDTKSLDTGQTVSVFFKNQKQVDLQKFNSSKLKISVQSNKIPEILAENNNQRETEDQKPHLKNTDPRLEMRKSNDSIFEFCKEKNKEPPITEFENGKTNMASRNQKIIFEFESGKSYMASQYDKTKFEHQNGKTNMSSQLDGTKSNMASTSNGFDVLKPQTMMNRIELNRFNVRSKDMSHRLKLRMEEWLCFYSQVMEESLTSILQKHSPSELPSPPPWSLLEALRCLDAACAEQATVRKIVGHLCSCLYDSSYKLKKFIHPEEFMRALGCGAKLLEYLEIILPSIDIQDGVSALQALLAQIEDDTDPTAGLSEPLHTTSSNPKTDEIDVRQNFVKDKSQVADYLKKHFPAWKDYDPSEDIKVFRTRGKKDINLEKITKVSDRKNEETIDGNGRNNAGNVAVADSTETKNVGKYYCDKNNVDDINLFELDSDKNIVVRKENYDINKTGAVNNRKKHVENNIDVYKPKKVKDGKVQYEKEPTVIRKVGILKEFETKPRKRKTKPVLVDIKPVKKQKTDVKPASNDNTHNETAKKYAKVNSNPKNTLYRPDKDLKLIYSPKVVIKANLISDYQEEMRAKKAKKLQTEDINYHSMDNELNKYNLNSYNGINHNHNHHLTKYQSDNSDHNDNQVTKIKNYHNKEHNDNHNDDNNNHNEDNDNNNKDVTTDSGLRNELPRWSSVVDSYTTEIEKSLSFILRNMSSALATFREDSAAETFRMRAFEMDYLTCRLLAMLRSLLRHRTDHGERAGNLDAVAKYMAQAKSIHNVVNSILSVTNYLLPVSSDLSLNF